MPDFLDDPLGEHRFTFPRSACPHPEWWHSDDGQATEHEVTELVGAMVRALQPEYVVETGSFSGQTTHAIGKALQRNGHGHCDSLEINEGHALVARQRCIDLPVTIILASSLGFTPASTIDFAWFDSDPDSRIPEFNLYRPHMRVGTICGFHDTSPHHAPWAEQLPFIEGTQVITLPTPRGVSFLEVL